MWLRMHNVVADALYVYGGGREGILYSLDGVVSPYCWGHERFHVTATFDEAQPDVLVSRVFDIWARTRAFRSHSMDQEMYTVESQGIPFDTKSATAVFKALDYRIAWCSKTGWEWHVC